jgi:hypothetical protein
MLGVNVTAADEAGALRERTRILGVDPPNSFTRGRSYLARYQGHVRRINYRDTTPM